MSYSRIYEISVLSVNSAFCILVKWWHLQHWGKTSNIIVENRKLKPSRQFMIKTQKNCPETGKVLSSVFTRSYGCFKVGVILCFFFSKQIPWPGKCMWQRDRNERIFLNTWRVGQLDCPPFMSLKNLLPAPALVTSSAIFSQVPTQISVSNF